MPRCDYCGEPVFFPFECKYCGGSYCEVHRLPFKHKCDGISLYYGKTAPKGVVWEINGYGESFRESSATGTSKEVIHSRGVCEDIVPYIPDTIFQSTESDEPLPGWEELGIRRDMLDYLYKLPFKKYCYYCGKRLHNEPIFICRTCDLSFCDEHRLPEIHNCQGKRKYVLPPKTGYKELIKMSERNVLKDDPKNNDF